MLEAVSLGWAGLVSLQNASISAPGAVITVFAVVVFVAAATVLVRSRVGWLALLVCQLVVLGIVVWVFVMATPESRDSLAGVLFALPGIAALLVIAGLLSRRARTAVLTRERP